MAKARSSRRMRNCKSRNKRVGGGMFGDGSCINCSTFNFINEYEHVLILMAVTINYDFRFFILSVH